MEGCLEPEGLESDALEGQIIDEERVDFDGISEEEIPQELLHQVAAVQQQDSASGKQSAFSFGFFSQMDIFSLQIACKNLPAENI